MYTIVSLNRAVPRPLKVGKKVITSGIYKESVQQRCRVTALGLESDFIGSPKYHGGKDQALYIYSANDYEWWQQELKQKLPHGFFGENLTINQWWKEARVGDRLLFQNLTLELSFPRIPCNTLAARAEDKTFVKRFARAERPGAYARVITSGSLQAGENFHVIHTASEAPQIADLFRWSVGGAAARMGSDIANALHYPLACKMRSTVESWLAKPLPMEKLPTVKC